MLRNRALLQGSKEDEDNMTRKLEENTIECLRKHILHMKNIATGRAMLHIMLANGKSENYQENGCETACKMNSKICWCKT
jgi:hypothetical protein